MIALQIILWVMATLGLAIFLQFYFLPYIKTKWTFYVMSKRIKKIANKYDGETGEQLKEIAKGLMNLSKSEKLIDDEDEGV